jgi:hypothetical protein
MLDALQAFRAAGAQPADPEGTFWPPAAEIENFTVTPKGSMAPTEWGREHYFGATFSDTFASRKARRHRARNA